MRKLLYIIIATLALLLGTAAMNEAKAQVYMYYDPFEVPESEFDDEDAEAIDTIQFSPETTTLLICMAVVIWGFLIVLLLRFKRFKKNREKRFNMERFGNWNMRRASFVWLFLLFVMPVKAQVFLDEEKREYTMRVNAAPPDAKPIKPNNTREYVPLGGEVLVLGLLGGAYLLGKKRKE